MITEDKVIEIYALADDFCKVCSRQLRKDQLDAPKITRNYHRPNKLSDAEVITILILFHLKGYRCLKKCYLEHVCVNMRDVFPKLVSYNRFVELQQSVMLPLTIFLKEVLLGEYTGFLWGKLVSFGRRMTH